MSCALGEGISEKVHFLAGNFLAVQVQGRQMVK